MKPLEQAVIISCDFDEEFGKIKERQFVFQLEDMLRELFEKRALGEYDGHEIGETSARLFMYVKDAARVAREVQSEIEKMPDSKQFKLRMVIRNGPPGAPEREVVL